jgi:hypothetical protein
MFTPFLFEKILIDETNILKIYIYALEITYRLVKFFQAFVCVRARARV